ncbi:MAG: four-carbon acid sugar kinase family protein [Piscinibacter sp.]
MPLRSAFYGDDFTGATDTLATYADAGWRTRLFLGVPTARQLAASGALDVIGIAGAARALPPEAMADELAPVAAFFAALEAPLLHYKCCSTFDSAVDTGNLATAIAALRVAAEHPQVAIVGGQPSLGRYCLFGQLFASAGSPGAVHRIDRHPTMSRHPVTPMHEADLSRHLAALGLEPPGTIDWRALDAGLAASRWAALADARTRHVLFDAQHAGHIAAIGRLLWHEARQARLLAVGASSVAEALLGAWRDAGDLPPSTPAPAVAAATGPVLVIAGSRSPVTAEQVRRASAYELLPVAPAQLAGATAQLDVIAADAAQRLGGGRSVLLQLGAEPAEVPPAALAQACGELLVEVLARAPALRRVGIAGGDTSSLALRRLGPWALSAAGRLGSGVTLVRAHADTPRHDGLELMLKGGQMGPPDLFDRLLAGSA